MSTTVAAWASRSRPGRQLFRSALGAAAFALASTVFATPGGPRSSTHLLEHQKVPVQVVVVTLDGARFQEIFWGVDAAQARKSGTPLRIRDNARELMPNLHRLMTEDGAALGAGRGPHISASGPDFVSLPGYAEIFTGRRATGCLDNSCPGASFESIADQVAAQSSAAKSAIITSWPAIARVASRSKRVAISTGRHAGLTRRSFERPGAVGDALRAAENEKPWPGNGDFRRDRFTASLALGYLRAERPDFLFVGLGETDEFAHQGNYAGYLDALREADRFLGEVSAELAGRSREGVKTALIVTADHGRADSFKEHGKSYPESARVWLVASGTAITARGFVTSPEPRRLADIAPTLRTVLGLPVDGSRGAGSPLTELLLQAR